MREIVLPYVPQPKQAMLHACEARQILFGGSIGGSKSHGLRWDCIYWCLRQPGLEAYLFRRTYVQLEDNHIRKLVNELPRAVAEYRASKNLFQFMNGSKLILCHAADTYDYLKYQGSEIHVLAIDEAALFETIQLVELRSRVRLGGFRDKILSGPYPEDIQYLPRMVLSSNPGGPSHSFLKRTFLDPAPAMTVFYDKELKDPDDPEDKGWKTCYIPARMRDNKYIDKNYAAALAAMPKERARALREGDWSAIEGSAMHLLSVPKHQVRSFKPPQHWVTFSSMDWGTASPYAVIWFTVAGEDAVISNNPQVPKTDTNPKQSILIPKGSLIAFHELYGWTGKENEGLRETSVQVAEKILRFEKERDIHPEYRVADSSMWNKVDGPSPAERMMEAGIIMAKSRRDRMSNYDEINCRLAGSPYFKEQGEQETHPALFITDNCLQIWRTLPTLLLDKTYPDKGPEEGGEDHLYDAMVYGLASRPYVRTKGDRSYEEWKMYKRLTKKSIDHYATR